MKAAIPLKVSGITAKLDDEGLTSKLTQLFQEVAKLSAKNGIQLELDLSEMPEQDIERFAEVFARAANSIQAQYGSIWEFVIFSRETLDSKAYILQKKINPVQEKIDPVQELIGVQHIQQLVYSL